MTKVNQRDYPSHRVHPISHRHNFHSAPEMKPHHQASLQKIRKMPQLNEGLTIAIGTHLKNTESFLVMLFLSMALIAAKQCSETKSIARTLRS